MASDRVRIRPTYSPNPRRQENYTLFCNSHVVRITVTDKPAVVRRWIYAVRRRHRLKLRQGRLVVGLGVQWAPERLYDPATLQLCIGRKCLIFQLGCANKSPAILHRLLSDTDVILVGVRNYRDEALLEESKHRLQISRLVDLRDVASDLMSIGRMASMETLAANILGMHGMVKEKWVGMSDWNAAWLSEEQVKYASLDVLLPCLMGMKLKIWKWV